MPTMEDLRRATQLHLDAEVRYWEDAEVNGQPEDDNAPLIPHKHGPSWKPVIDLASGKILDWPQGTTAKTHYKVCDAGTYTLTDAAGVVVARIDGYVPAILAPNKNGFGDYIILDIQEDGTIAHWHPDLDAFAG